MKGDGTVVIGRDYIQNYLNQEWPGWVISKKIGAGTFGSVYEIYRDGFGPGQGTNRLVCALKVLFMEAPVQELSDTQKTVRLGDLRNAYPDTFSYPGEQVRKKPRQSALYPQYLEAEPSFPGNQKNRSLLYRHVSETMIDDFIRNVSTEVNTMIGLKGYPHIVSIEDYMIKRDDHYCMILIRMEKLNCLSGYIREGGQNLNREQVIRLGIDICKALELCERNNVIHRDIKPSNLFFSERTGYKLGDFGISRTMESIYESASMSGVGTPQYMAPEIFEGRKYNNTADIYSLGVVLYQLMNDGFLPLIRENMTTTGGRRERDAFIRRMKGEKLPVPVKADKDLSSIILKSCAYDPKDRYATAVEFRMALEHCLERETKHDPEKEGKIKRFIPRAIAGVAIAAAVFLAASALPQILASGGASQTDAGSIASENMTVDLPAGASGETSGDGTGGETTGGNEEDAGLASADLPLENAEQVFTDPVPENIELTFADPALEKAIRQDLQIEEDTPLTRELALQVTELDLAGGGKDKADKITDLDGLSAFENLEELDIQKNNISDIAELSELRNLKELMMESNQISDLSPLSGLDSLREIEATDNQISDITPILTLRNLNLLELIDNRISSIDGIGSLNKLHTLRIGNNQISDISPVGELNDLTYLGFGYNEVEEISVLYDMPMLHYLTMSWNHISDIGPVVYMKELKWLEVAGNPIEDETIFERLPESVKHLEK